MATTVTIKGQVTLPKDVRETTGIKPGDRVNVRATAAGTVIIEKSQSADDYEARLRALAKRRLIRDGMNTDEFMRWMRGDPEEDPPAPKP